MSSTRTTVTFNGTNLTNLYVVSGWHAPLLSRNFDTVDIAGMDGQRFLGATLAPRTITLALTVKGSTLAAREEAARTLAATLNVDEPKRLTASFMGGKYYLAIPSSNSDLQRFVNADTFEVSFLVPDPVAYGDLVTINISSFSSSTPLFTVGGNYPTLPTVTLDMTRASTSGASEVEMVLQETRTFLDFAAAMHPSATTATAILNSETRTYTCNTSEYLLPLEGDWPLIKPGQQRLTMRNAVNCTGTGTMTFRERWV